MKRYIWIILLCSFNICAQVTTKYDLKTTTPSVAQFSRYEEQPITEYTGIPNISIPIYTIQEDDFELPLNLTYHAGGIKVNQDASWVGLGWDLTIGCVIQEIADEDDFGKSIIKLIPDWYKTGIANAGQVPYHTYEPLYFGHCPLIFKDNYRCWKGQDLNIAKPEFDHGYAIARNFDIPVKGKMVYDEGFFTHSNKDSEPDIFTANILGVVLKFLYDTKSKRSIVLNKQDYKVRWLDNQWIITDPNGNIFYFKQKQTINYDVNNNYQKEVKNIWYLNEIVTNRKGKITINYQNSGQEVVTKTLSHTFSAVQAYDQYHFHGTWIYTVAFSGSASNNYEFADSIQVLRETPCYIESINFSGGKILFNLENRIDINGTKRLSEINVIDNEKREVKKINFNHEYFTETPDGKTTLPKKRLKLASCSDNSQIYKFRYNITPLPTKNNYAQDHWGYYNGNHSNKSLLPNPKRFGLDVKASFITNNNEVRLFWESVGGQLFPPWGDPPKTVNKASIALYISNNKSANLRYIKAGILEEIEYPTGGKVWFDYELNEFDNFFVPDHDSLNNVISKGLGLRVKSIIHKDHNNQILKQTNYKYNGGLCISPIKNMFSFMNKQYIITSGEPGIMVEAVKTLVITSQGTMTSNPLSSNEAVGYSVVSKRITNYLNQDDNGEVVTEFHTTNDIAPIFNKGDDIYAYIALPVFKDRSEPANGVIKSQKIYDKNKVCLKQDTFEYKNILSDLYYGVKTSGYAGIYGLIVTGIQENKRVALEYVNQNLMGYYPIFDFETLTTKSTTTNYFGGDSIISVTEYIYDDLNRKIITKNTGATSDKTVVQEYLYPETNSNLFIQNMLNFPIKINKYIKTLENNLVTPIMFQEMDYKAVGANNALRLSKYTLRRSNNDFNERITSYDQFDNYGNVLQATEFDGSIIVYLWSYMGQYPIAEIKNATYEQVRDALGGQTYVDNLSNTISLSNADKDKIDKLRTTLPNAFVTTYTYKPLVGMLTATDPRGVTTYYDYDSFGRLKETYIKENGSKKKFQDYEYHYRNQ